MIWKFHKMGVAPNHPIGFSIYKPGKFWEPHFNKPYIYIHIYNLSYRTLSVISSHWRPFVKAMTLVPGDLRLSRGLWSLLGSMGAGKKHRGGSFGDALSPVPTWHWRAPGIPGWWIVVENRWETPPIGSSKLLYLFGAVVGVQINGNHFFVGV